MAKAKKPAKPAARRAKPAARRAKPAAKPAKKAAARTSWPPLVKLLAALDPAWLRALPDAADTLKPGAAPAALATLPPACEELQTWFAWHDGQTRPKSLSDNRYLLSLAEARDAQRFLVAEAEGYQPTWFPLLANGAGDYLVFETAPGKGHGALLEYWHDSDDRGLAFASVSAWARMLAIALSRMPAGKRTPASPDYTKLAPVLEGAWQRAPVPTAEHAKAAAAGTLFRCEHVPMIAGGRTAMIHAYLEVAAGAWVAVSLPVDVDAVIANLGERLRAAQHVTLDDAAFVKRLVTRSLTRWMKQDPGGWATVAHDELFVTRVRL
jgi:cell wall assembly regulator SMI1